MTIFTTIRQDILRSLDILQLPSGLSYDAITAEPPRDASHGDVSTNAAMVLAKPTGKNPRQLAEALIQQLKTVDYIQDASVAGPGFINLKLDPALWQNEITQILTHGVHYGDSDLGGNDKVNIEYVSANPTGPMHIGHTRGGGVR